MTQPIADPEDQAVHALLPNMATACGVGFLDLPIGGDGGRRWVLGGQGATCSDCLAQPIADLCQQMQRRQA